tara:strand:- start:310 stop:645 length:336 start_codon:yes stop_codon:yes gene_type:complete
MATLYTKVKKYLEANSKTWEAERNNIILQNDSDGNGDYIHTWSVDGLAKPTAEQLATYESSGNDVEALNVILNNRKQEYPSWQDQLDDIYHNGIDGWKATIKVTKDKYSKS